MPEPLPNRDTHKQQLHLIMRLEDIIRVLAGTMVLAALALAHWVHPNFIWLAAFVGVNLIQSAFTHFCPAEIFLKKLGIGKGNCCSLPEK